MAHMTQNWLKQTPRRSREAQTRKIWVDVSPNGEGDESLRLTLLADGVGKKHHLFLDDAEIARILRAALWTSTPDVIANWLAEVVKQLEFQAAKRGRQ